MTSTPENRADLLGHQLAMHLRGAHAHLRKRSNAVFSTFGVSTDQFVLLGVLAQGGEATQQELVKRCYSDAATIGTMVLLLADMGLVSRVRHPEDGRAWWVKLTSKGIALARELRQASCDIRTSMVALFRDEELRLLLEFLQRLERAMCPPPRTTVASRFRRKRPQWGEA